MLQQIWILKKLKLKGNCLFFENFSRVKQICRVTARSREREGIYTVGVESQKVQNFKA